jgi:hypothetical protein
MTGKVSRLPGSESRIFTAKDGPPQGVEKKWNRIQGRDGMLSGIQHAVAITRRRIQRRASNSTSSRTIRCTFRLPSEALPSAGAPAFRLWCVDQPVAQVDHHWKLRQSNQKDPRQSQWAQSKAQNTGLTGLHQDHAVKVVTLTGGAAGGLKNLIYCPHK